MAANIEILLGYPNVPTVGMSLLFLLPWRSQEENNHVVVNAYSFPQPVTCNEGKICCSPRERGSWVWGSDFQQVEKLKLDEV